MRRALFEVEHDAYRESFRTFLDRVVVPHYAGWEEAGLIPRDVYSTAAAGGFIGMSVAEEHGGSGVDDFRFNLVLIEECMRSGLASFCMGLGLQNELCLPYLVAHGSEAQQRRWLPELVAGEKLAALALTEPGAGSDLAAISTSARRVGDGYLVNGSKTFITGGLHCDLAITAVKTDAAAGRRGISLLLIESDASGFSRGEKLDKIGLLGQDTAELFFDDVLVPTDNLLGAEGGGFEAMRHGLALERLSIASMALSAASAALEWTLDYVHERKAFGRPIGTFQNSRFVLAEIKTEVDVTQAFLDRCCLAHNDATLTAEDAAAAKWWCTELQGRVIDRCLQLFGGYGYIREYPISRAYADARITRIYGGTTEIMKEIVGRSMGLR